MKRFLYGVVLILLLITLANCSNKIQKPDNYPQIQEPNPEQEKKIKLAINFNGKWVRGEKAVIIIEGKKGRVVAKNGAQISIVIKYLSPNSVKIIENNYTPDYLVNWLPEPIAIQAAKSGKLKAYSVLTIVDNESLKGTMYGWKVIHDYQNMNDIEPFMSSEDWKRIR